MDKNSALIALSESDSQRFWKVEFDELSEPEQTFRLIWELESQVNNGGFEQYYANSSGENAHAAPAALLRIGAAKTADLVSRALRLLPSGKRPDDVDDCMSRIEELPARQREELQTLDSEFYEYPDDLTELLYAYVSRHRASIAGAKDLIK